MRRFAFVGSAVLASFVSMFAWGCDHASATTLTVSFTGLHPEYDDQGNFQNYSSVVGSLALSPISTTPTGPFGWEDVDTTWHISVDGPDAFSHTASGTSELEYYASPGFSEVAVTADTPPGANPSSDLQLAFESAGSSPSPILTLNDIPTDLAGIIAFLGGVLSDEHGSFHFNGAETDFDVTSAKFAVGDTPIPATLPLFISAIGGLGFVSWRRKLTMR